MFRSKASKRILAALLSCLLLGTITASAADAPSVQAEGTLSVLDNLLQNDAPLVIEEEPEEPADPEPEPSPEPEPEIKTYTVTFQMGSFGTQTREVEEGRYVNDVPSIPSLPAAEVQGWFDAAGQKVQPGSVPVTADTTYTARWSRNVNTFLKTDSHEAYIKGYSSGTFRPHQNVSRSEAAQLFYNLIRNPVGGANIFPDVKPTDWFAPAVQEMAANGILQGGADGKFNGTRSINRAEFVKMAVACDTLEDSVCPFNDVPANAWFAPYVATAYKKGWITGGTNGMFRPHDPITRGEAVVILNRVLGRSADPDIQNKTDVKNFYDVFPDSWMYPYIVEASTTHQFTRDGSGEIWTTYEQDLSTATSGWVNDNGSRYYLDGTTRKFLRGEHTIDKVRYIFDQGTGAAYTGFRNEGTWRRYYKNGIMLDDISNLGVVSGPYYIKVYKPSNYLIIYAREYAGGPYNVPVKAMRTSCGYGTPTGTFYTPTRYRWLQMIGGTWAQWCTQIKGSYLFHSVPNWTHDNFNLEVGEYNRLGETRSAGCIRLNCENAKWIYDNCQLGTKVDISSWETGGPLAKPAGIQIPSWHTWDPTDPTAYWKCKQKGCH